MSDAFRHQIEEEILKVEQNKHKQELENLKNEIEEKTRRKIAEELDLKLKNQEEEVKESKQQNRKLQEQLLELTKQLRSMKQKDEEREIEMQKKLLEERSKMQEEISKAEKERSNLELGELKKQLEDTKKLLEDAKRKAEQKSQQLQGEILELNLENELKLAFSTDEILPVPKGIEGGDILQKVKNKHGQVAGIILWELKRTKAWSNPWLSKLRENTRQAGASIPILVSEVLPEGVSTFDYYERVWVTSYKYAIPLSNALRLGLMQVAIAKSAVSHKDEKMEDLYSYLTNDGFRHRFEAQVESMMEMKKDLDAEQRSTVRLWKKREIQIKRLMNNIAGLYGEFQGILGSALPSIQSLETEPLQLTSEQVNLLPE